MLNVRNRSHSITAEVVVPESGAEGVAVAQGGAFGGWMLYTRAGRLKHCHNFIGLQRFAIEGEGPARLAPA